MSRCPFEVARELSHDLKECDKKKDNLSCIINVYKKIVKKYNDEYLVALRSGKKLSIDEEFIFVRTINQYGSLLDYWERELNKRERKSSTD